MLIFVSFSFLIQANSMTKFSAMTTVEQSLPATIFHSEICALLASFCLFVSFIACVRAHVLLLILTSLKRC